MPDSRANHIWRPEREIEIAAGTSAGGGLDRVARALAKTFDHHAILGVPVRVTNLPGDGARKVWRYVDEHVCDPHLISISSPNLTSDYLTGLASFDHNTYSPIAILLTEYIAFAVRSNSALQTASDFLDRLQRDPGNITVALSTALGNPNHIAFLKLAQHVGADIALPKIHVFDNALDAVADVVQGHADIAAVTATSTVPALQAATARVLAIAAPGRLDGVFADVPVWRDFGVDCVAGAWRGVTGPAGIEPGHRAFWEAALRAATATPSWHAELAGHHWSPFYLDGTALTQHLAEEDLEISAKLKQLGLLRATSR